MFGGAVGGGFVNLFRNNSSNFPKASGVGALGGLLGGLVGEGVQDILNSTLGCDCGEVPVF